VYLIELVFEVIFLHSELGVPVEIGLLPQLLLRDVQHVGHWLNDRGVVGEDGGSSHVLLSAAGLRLLGVDFVLEWNFIDESQRNAVVDRIPRDWLVLGDEAVSVRVGDLLSVADGLGGIWSFQPGLAQYRLVLNRRIVEAVCQVDALLNIFADLGARQKLQAAIYGALKLLIIRRWVGDDHPVMQEGIGSRLQEFVLRHAAQIHNIRKVE